MAKSTTPKRKAGTPPARSDDSQAPAQVPAAGPTLASADELMAAGPADVDAALRATAPAPTPPTPPTPPPTPEPTGGQGTPTPAAESAAAGQSGPATATGGAPSQQPPKRKAHRATGRPRGRPPKSATGPFSGPVSDPPGRATASKIEMQARLDALESENAQLRARVMDVDTERLRVALDLSFGAVGQFAAQKLGPEAALDDAECDTLSEAWAAALAPYMGEYMQESPLVAAGLVTVMVIQTKRTAIAEARKQRNAVSLPAVEVTP